MNRKLSPDSRGKGPTQMGAGSSWLLLWRPGDLSFQPWDQRRAGTPGFSNLLAKGGLGAGIFDSPRLWRAGRAGDTR
jgi:hypothetical protein